MGLKKKIENFWYYYKWMFIVCVIFVLFIAVCIVQYFQKSEYDGYIMFAGGTILSNSDREAIASSVETAMKSDPDGNGKKSVNVYAVTLYSASDGYYGDGSARNNQQKGISDYNNELLIGDSCILLLDYNIYSNLSETGVLAELPDSPLGNGYYLADLSIKNTDGFSVLPENTVLCIKYPGENKDRTKEQCRELFDKNMAVFSDMVSYRFSY